MKKNTRDNASVMKKTKPKVKAMPMLDSNLSKEILSLVFFMLAVFIYIGLLEFSNQPDANRFIGIVGTNFLGILEKLFGEGAVGFAFFLLACSIHLGVLKKSWSSRMWGAFTLYITTLIFLSIWDIPGGLSPWEAGIRGMGGGYVGGILALAAMKLIGDIGCQILVALLFFVAMLLIINKPIITWIRVLSAAGKAIRAGLTNFLMVEEKEPLTLEIENTKAKKFDNEPVADVNSMGQDLSKRAAKENSKLVFDIEPEIFPKAENLETEKNIQAAADSELVMIKKESDIGLVYKKPSLDLLSNVRNERSIDKKNIKASISLLEETFANFSIAVKVNQVSCGPAVTRYELTPAPGVKISRILGLADDLQLSLAAPGIRLEAPIPGKAAIGVEVPNQKIMGVGLRQLISSKQFSSLNSPLAIALGEDITGNPVVAKLSDFPHLLIAGSTGSGKSVCLNGIIMSLLFNTNPEEMKLVFIDPKMVELTVYNGIPHLLTPVVTNPKKAAVILKWMVAEMEKRYTMFADAGVRDIYRYNQANIEKQLPIIVIVIDELADLMMVSPVDVEDSICRLAQMARAAGMHLIVATQRPSVDVVTGIIKANIPSRIAFAVSSQADSRTILDSGGAEKLLGKGDMLFLPVGVNKPFRVQGAYVSDNEIENTVEFLRNQNNSETEMLDFNEIETENTELFEEDELFWDAVTVFVESHKASVSLLQRKLRVGYSRAARLVDVMEERGIVSSADNNKKREVLIDKEQLLRLQERSVMSI